MATATHHVYNPTGSTITVGANSVTTHATAVLTLNDADLLSFHAAGATSTQLAPGTADQAHIRGYLAEGAPNRLNDPIARLSAASGTIAVTTLATAASGGGSAFAQMVSAGASVRLDDGHGHTQTFPVAAEVFVGGTAFTFASTAPNFNYPAGTAVYAV